MIENSERRRLAALRSWFKLFLDYPFFKIVFRIKEQSERNTAVLRNRDPRDVANFVEVGGDTDTPKFRIVNMKFHGGGRR